MDRVYEHARRLHPKLRMLRNGDRQVNALRSDGAATVATTLPAQELGPPRSVRTALQASALPRVTQAKDQADRPGLPERPKLTNDRVASDSFVNVFIEFLHEPEGRPEQQRTAMSQVEVDANTALPTKVISGNAALQRRNIVQATVPISMLAALERNPAIAFVHPAEPLKLDVPVSSRAVAPEVKAVGSAETHGRGEGVIIGLIDVGGFDFAHEEFLDDEGNTRFLAIWDQGGDFREPPAAFGYGAEFRKAELDAAIAASKTGAPPAVMLEPQSQMEPGSHGTHVASIAAGRSGVCPKASIAAVLVDVPAPSDPLERRRSTFCDTSRIAHAVEYLLKLALEHNLPISINISLGTNGGPHDGASGVSRWLDAYLSTPGRAICVAAGNAGQEAAESDTDLGWIMGRIHTSGRIRSSGLEVELEWTVVGDGVEDMSENELEVWYPAQDRLSVLVNPPGSTEWIKAEPRQFVENRRLPSGTTVSIYNELYHPTNGSNYVAIYLSPNLDPVHYRGIDAGVWRVRLHGEQVRDGRFNAWIERDDPAELGIRGSRRLFRFPSFFSARSNVDSHSISSLACGHRVIAVANLDASRQRIAASSSQGPTRDGRCKPEIAARGTDVVAANAFHHGDPWVRMSGTSMASPYVAGVVGLMLGANRSLTAAQCAGILQRTARPLPGGSYEWANDAGFGVVDAEEAVLEARMVNARLQVT